MAGYTKEFLIDVFMSRFLPYKNITIETLENLEALAIKLYDEKGRDEFRAYGSLDAQAIKEYKLTL